MTDISQDVQNEVTRIRDMIGIKFKEDVINELGKLQDKITQIQRWVDVYPLSVFPEPNFKKANEILKRHGMFLDDISAGNMRHVLNRIKNIIESSERKCYAGRQKGE